MKKLRLIILFLLVSTYAFSQRPPIGDWYDYQLGLREGDTLPNIALGETTNNHTGKTSFSQFKGKIIILDYWNTGCGACMSGFEKMEKIQNDYSDKIQIFLVNPWETKEKIEKEMKKKHLRKYSIPKNLISISNAVFLNELLPSNNGVPHHVLIDTNGIIKARGIGIGRITTSEENIENIWNGSKPNYIRDGNTTPFLNEEITYGSVALAGRTLSTKNGSFISTHNNNYAAWNGAVYQNIKDSASRTIRSTFVNREIAELYKFTFLEEINSNGAKVISTTNKRNGNYWIDYFELNLADTAEVTCKFLTVKNLTAKTWAKNKYCYEQIRPDSISERGLTKMMFLDLNKFFNNKIGLNVRAEVKLVPCYILIRKDKKRNIIEPLRKEFVYKVLEYSRDNVSFRKFVHYPILDILESTLYKLVINDKTGIKFIFNETGYKIDQFATMELPNFDFITLEKIRPYLNRYGLDIIPGKRKLSMLIFEEKRIAK